MGAVYGSRFGNGIDISSFTTLLYRTTARYYTSEFLVQLLLKSRDSYLTLSWTRTCEPGYLNQVTWTRSRETVTWCTGITWRKPCISHRGCFITASSFSNWFHITGPDKQRHCYDTKQRYVETIQDLEQSTFCNDEESRIGYLEALVSFIKLNIV